MVKTYVNQIQYRKEEDKNIHDYKKITISKNNVDIYCPDKKNYLEKDPVIFYIHGGAWHIGDKSYSKNPCEILADHGFCCVATGYHLTPLETDQIGWILSSLVFFLLALCFTSSSTNKLIISIFFLFLITVFIFFIWIIVISPEQQKEKEKHLHPRHMYDIAENLKWTIDNIWRYNGDNKQIYLMGHSAGGHLATLLVLNKKYTNLLIDDIENYVKGCISISGLYNDKRLKQSEIGRRLLKSVFGKKKEYLEDFPIYHVRPNIKCKFLLMNAEYEYMVKKHTLDFHYMLLQNNVDVETVYWEKNSHFSIMQHWNKKNKPILEKVISFIRH